MAFAATTLSAAVGANDTSILVASLTGVSVGMLARVDNEMMKVLAPLPSAATSPVFVARGQEGSAQVAHATSARVIFGLTQSNTGTDWTAQAPGVFSPAMFPAYRPRTVTSYSAAGAIALPAIGTDAVAIINGTGALAMTLANPSTAQDGDILIVVANGKAAHTLTYTAGLGNGGSSFDVGTYSATLAMSSVLIACGGFWVLVGPSSATAMAGSPTWA
jgi:hypothetical protein